MAGGGGGNLPGITAAFNPTPGNPPGQVTPMAPAGVGGPGGAPAMAKKELMTNSVCSYPLFARPWREGYEKHLAPFDALFIDCSSKDVARGVSNSHQSYRIMNLPLLNTWLAKHVFKKRTDGGNAAANAAIDELVENLCFIGTHRNDMQLSGGKPGHAHGGRTSAYRRLINIDCRGASRPSCRDGNPGDTYLEPCETLRRVIDVGFVYEHVPRAFSPSVGAAKSAMTTFSGNDALPVISVFMRT